MKCIIIIELQRFFVILLLSVLINVFHLRITDQQFVLIDRNIKDPTPQNIKKADNLTAEISRKNQII